MRPHDTLGLNFFLFAAVVLGSTLEPMAVSLATQGPVRRAVLLDGEPLEVRLVSLSENWVPRLATAGGRSITLPAGELLIWGDYSDRETGPQILLADGSLLVADVLAITRTELTLASPLLEEITLPLTSVRGIVFQPPATPLDRDRLLDSLAGAGGNEDQLTLENGDVLQGAIVDPKADIETKHAGAERDTKNVRLRVKSRGEPLSLPFDRISVLVCNPAASRQPAAQTMRAGLGWGDGSWLIVDRIAPDRDPIQLTLACGVTLSILQDRFWTQLCCLRPPTPAVFLSDLKPASYKHIPFLERTWQFAADRSVLGGRLRAGERIHAKGLGMHSTSSLAFDLGGRYRRFQAELAVDDQAGVRGSVSFRVFLADQSGHWAAAYESPVVRGGDPPIPVSLDVTAARRISLIVEFAERGDELDHADWLNARILPALDEP